MSCNPTAALQTFVLPEINLAIGMFIGHGRKTDKKMQIPIRLELWTDVAVTHFAVRSDRASDSWVISYSVFC